MQVPTNKPFAPLAILFLIAPSFFINGVLSAQPSLQKQIDSLIMSWESTTRPGISLAVVKEGKVIYMQSRGMANIDAQKRNTTTTQLWIASLTKQFTAAAVYKLIHGKKLKPDESIRKYIPTLPAIFDSVTIGQLIHHTSGIRDGFVLTALSKQPEAAYTNANVLHYLSMQQAHSFSPGTRFEYNNGGYVLLAMLVEKISGQSYAQFLKTQIFDPLGMLSTYVAAGFPSDTVAAEGYHEENGRFVAAHFQGNTYGSTGIMTTIGDMTKWAQFLQQPSSCPSLKPIVKWMLEPGSLSNGHKIHYAGGLEQVKYKQEVAFEHFGSDPGFKSDIVYFPSKKLTIIGFTNNQQYYDLQRLLFHVSDVVLGIKQMPVPDFDAGAADSTAYFYNTTHGKLLRAEYRGRAIKLANTPGGYAAPYRRKNDTLISVDPIPVRYLHRNGNIQTLDENLLEQEVYARQIPDTTSKQDLSSFVGEYFSSELNTSYRVISTASGLAFEFVPGFSFDLFRVNGTDFIFEYVGANHIRFTPTGLLFSREGCHNLRFQKK